jgi:hypothetical protein
MFTRPTIALLIASWVTSSLAFSLHMAMPREAILKPFHEGKALKVISGLKNFDDSSVKNVVKAAKLGGASHVDIACSPDLVRIVRKHVGNMPIIVSSIVPKEFVDAVNAGADMIELGNFDAFYEQGLKFTAADVITMTKEARSLLPDIPISVTIPHTLSLVEQIDLAKSLEKCGVDILQTEGKMSVHSSSMGIQELIETAAPTIASAYALSRAVSIPVLCASGLTDVTAPLAIAAGARGVGIGSMINKLFSLQQMVLAVSAISTAMGREIRDQSAEVGNIFTENNILNKVQVEN